MEAMLDMSAAPALASKVASGISRPDMVVKGSWSLPSIGPLMRPRSLPAMISIESDAIIGGGNHSEDIGIHGASAGEVDEVVWHGLQRLQEVGALHLLLVW